VIYREDKNAPWHLVETNTQLEEDSLPYITSTLPIYSYQNTLAEVYDELKAKRSGAVIIKCHLEEKVYGIITWDALHRYLFKLEH
jgi:hypothetical protein